MRIVVVEDEAPIREGMAKLLSKINPEYELVGKAADGEAGYQLIRELNPDLVIMDIRMPKMDGIAMMKKLREENIKCKAIILSAYSEFQYAQKAIELKADSYLLKPIIEKCLKTGRERNLRGSGDRADFFRGKYYVGLYAWSGAPEFTIK